MLSSLNSMADRENYILWPVYFDRSVSRKRGRRVAREMAVSHPSMDVIYKAAQKLGLNPKIEKKSYPSRWWKKEGCILVDRKKSKTEILHDIAKIISEKSKQ